jgi:hypothetical protein
MTLSHLTIAEKQVLRIHEEKLTLTEREESHSLVLDILENLDDNAIAELFGGYEDDIDDLLRLLTKDVHDVIFTGNHEIDFRLSYADSLTNTIEETLRIENFNYFISSALPDFQMSWHHVEWGEAVMKLKKLNVIAARDHGKSYFFSNAYPIWRMYGYAHASRSRNDLRRSLAKRGFLFSFSLQQAVDLLDIIKENISSNDFLRERLYPDNTREGWGKTDIVCRNGARMTVRGFGSSVRGAHPGWIVVDDGLKDNVIYSALQRKKSIDYFHSVIMNMLVPGGQCVVVGTPFHANDLYGDLKSKPAWTVREYPAVFPDGKILWSKRWNYDDLMEKRSSQGSIIFSRELLCRPVTNESSLFPLHLIQTSYLGMESYNLVDSRESFPKKFDKVVTACDFSISSSVGADYSVFMTAGIDEDNKIWLLNIQRFRGKSFGEQIAILRHINASFRPDLILMEQNVFQVIFVQESEKYNLPVEGHHTGSNKHDLRSGIPGLVLKFERGQIKLPRGDQRSVNETDSLASELMSITWTENGIEGVGEHDDQAVCTWILCLAANKVNTGFKWHWV